MGRRWSAGDNDALDTRTEGPACPPLPDTVRRGLRRAARCRYRALVRHRRAQAPGPGPRAPAPRTGRQGESDPRHGAAAAADRDALPDRRAGPAALALDGYSA